MAIKAQKMGSNEAVKAQNKKGGGASLFQSIPADSSLTVRFLTEPSEWVGFYEWYDSDLKSFVPQADGDELPSGSRPSFKYLASVLVQSEGVMKGKVVALKFPKSLGTDLMICCDKYKTLTDRDYECTRIGATQNDTTYKALPEAPAKIARAQYKPLDLIELLEKERETYDALASGVSKASAAAEEDDGELDLDALASAADEDDEDAQETLYAFFKENTDIDPDAVETWAECVEQYRAEVGDEGEAEEGEEEVDLATLAEAADEGDDDATTALYEWAAENTEVNPDEYQTWVEWAEVVAAEQGGDESEAEDETDWAALGEAADEGDDDAVAQLTAAAEEAGIDPDEIDTWAEVAEQLAGASEGEDGEVEIDLDTLNGMSLTELREFADQFGIEHKGLTKGKLVQAIIDSAE